MKKHNNNSLNVINKVATIMGCLMYISYIPQIYRNFSGDPVSLLQPLFATFNASLWVTYGIKHDYELPIIISNAPGIIFGLITVVTIYFH